MPRLTKAPPRAPVTRIAAALALTGALSACNTVVLKPSGDIAQQQGDLVVQATLLMLLIIVPVIAATLLFAWKYRASNKEATYEPDWDHSTKLEVLIWGAPICIIICLATLTYISTHALDPYRPLSRIAPNKPVTAADKPLEVDVVALDWKWLFIYPEQGVATVNQLVLPKDRPVDFHITASAVMNAFYIPAMAGQIYAMPGMETRLNGVLNQTSAEAGHDFVGFSSNYSGGGFSGMRFKVRSVEATGFDQWVAQVKAGGKASAGTLDTQTYLKLEEPSQNVPAMQYASVDSTLYPRILNLCVEPGKMCQADMMAIDAAGGLGKAGIHNVAMLTYDKHGREAGRALSANPDTDTVKKLAWVRALCEQRLSEQQATATPATASKSISANGDEVPQSTPARPSKISRN